MRTKRKPAKKRFLALFLCLSMVISMMNVGGNVWADEKPAVEGNDEIGEGTEAAPVTIKNEDVNPTYILQHYFNFPEVRMDEKIDNDKSEVKLNIINTSKTEGKLPDPQKTDASQYLSQVSVTKDSGKLETVPVLTKMFENEKVHFLEKPRMMYMNRLYNSDGNIGEDDYEEHFNENYTLKEVWVHQPGSPEKIDPNNIVAEDPQIDKLTEADFTIYKSPKLYDEEGKETDKHDPSRFIFTNNPDNPNLPKNQLLHEVPAPGPGESHTILIQTGTIIRLVFDVTDDKNYTIPGDEEGVLFFDYDITDGYIYHSLGLGEKFNTSTQDEWENAPNQKWNTSHVRTEKQGINSPDNIISELTAGSVRYGFGNINMGTGIGEETWNGQTINKYNDSNAGFGGASFGLVTGLRQNGTLIWADGIQAPAIFSREGGITGKKNYINKEFGLIFHREGGTYTLSKVIKNGSAGVDSEVATDTLEVFKSHDCSTGTGTDTESDNIIWANDFWPMDKAPSYGSDGHDFKFGATVTEGDYKTGSSKRRTYVGVAENGATQNHGNPPPSDDAIDHNSYFGMEFHADFVVDPGYVAPLRYFFYGDDDLWVFLSELDEHGNIKVKEDGVTTESTLIADLGGVHSSIGEFVDLWDHIDKIPYGGQSKRYRLTFFYTERGASGSSCYMRFSLPFESLVTNPPSYENMLRIEKKVESFDPVMDPIDENEEFVFKLLLFNENKTEFVNRYPYKRYKVVKDPETGEETVEEIEKSQDFMYTNATFRLKDGEYIEVENLPAGTTYRVEELNKRADGTPREYVSTTFYTSTLMH